MSHDNQRHSGLGRSICFLPALALTSMSCGSNIDQLEKSAEALSRTQPAADTAYFVNGVLNTFSLPRIRNNSIHLQLPLPVNYPAPGELEIRELLPEGEFGEDLSGEFDFVPEPLSLRINEQGMVLQNRHWYALISRSGWQGMPAFEGHFRALVGDVDNNGFVTAIDVGTVNASPAGIAVPYSRLDVNGDGWRTAVDVGLANAWQGLMPPKPSGHGD